VTFPRARTVAPLTLPALASMMTGLYPPQHGVRDDDASALVPAAVTLAESARAAGFDTVAVVPAEVRALDAALDQGFALWSRPESLDAASWLRERDRARPFFLWVHLPGPLARADAGLGELVAALGETGQLDDTLIVLAGTHGESNGEHGEEGHGHFVYEATLRVPLIVRLSGARRAGEVDEGVVSVVDVHPTLARALGLDVPVRRGDPARDLLRPRADDRGVYFESYRGYLHFGWSPLAGWVDAKAKYIHSSTPELYVPRTFADERVNQYSSYAEEVLDRYRVRLAAVGALRPLDGAVELPGPLAETGRPSPHARAAELQRYELAVRRAERGEREAAVRDLVAIAEANRANVAALELLVELLEGLGQREAAESWRALLQDAADS
jgi:hypothetical protein